MTYLDYKKQTENFNKNKILKDIKTNYYFNVTFVLKNDEIYVVNKNLKVFKHVSYCLEPSNKRLGELIKYVFDIGLEKITYTYELKDIETNYKGKKLKIGLTKEELKQFFLDNKDNIKYCNFGLYKVTGIGNKSIKIGEYTFYTYDELYNTYVHNVQSSKVLHRVLLGLKHEYYTMKIKNNNNCIELYKELTITQQLDAPDKVKIDVKRYILENKKLMGITE